MNLFLCETYNMGIDLGGKKYKGRQQKVTCSKKYMFEYLDTRLVFLGTMNRCLAHLSRMSDTLEKQTDCLFCNEYRFSALSRGLKPYNLHICPCPCPWLYPNPYSYPLQPLSSFHCRVIV